MANLRGGTFEKQIKDAFFRTLAIGKERYEYIRKKFIDNFEKKHLKTLGFVNYEEFFTKTNDVAKKREMYLRDFKEFLEQKGIQKGKLNQYMTEQNIKDFIEQRTMELSPKSALDYTTGFNSLLKGLQIANITIPANPMFKDFLKDFREVFREEMKGKKNEKIEYINNFKDKIKKLASIKPVAYITAYLQYQTGFKTRHIIKIIQKPAFHLKVKGNKVYAKGFFDKRNFKYFEREIDKELASLLLHNKEKIAPTTYFRYLKEVGIKNTSSIRATFYLNKIYQNQIKSVKLPFIEGRVEHFLILAQEELNISESTLNKYITNDFFLNSIGILDINILSKENYPVIKIPKNTNLILRKYVWKIIALSKKVGVRKIAKELEIDHNIKISHSSIYRFLQEIKFLKVKNET